MAKVREILYGPGYDPYAGFEPGSFDGFGWNSESQEFVEVFNELKPNLVVEVGTFFGGSARFMAHLGIARNLDIEIVCIDTFLGSVEHWHGDQYFKPAGFFKNGRPPIFDKFMTNTIRAELTNQITPFPIDSVNGGLTLKRYGIQADLVYIDGGHEYESVSQDLKVFKDIVRPGGIMLLDDSHYEPIQAAARNILGNTETKGTKIIWRK